MRIQILILVFKGLRQETPFHDPDSFHFTDRLILFFKLKKKRIARTTQLYTEAHTTNSAVWPVPYACAQPYHLGSGSHGQLFRPC